MRRRRWLVNRTLRAPRWGWRCSRGWQEVPGSGERLRGVALATMLALAMVMEAVPVVASVALAVPEAHLCGRRGRCVSAGA